MELEGQHPLRKSGALMGDAMQAIVGDADYITRGEFSEVRQDVKTLERQMVEVQTMQGAQGGQLAQILTNQEKQDKKLDNLQSTRQWIGWVLVIVTSTAAIQITTHLVSAL